MPPSVSRHSSRRRSRRPAVETLEPRIALAANAHADFLQISEIMYNPADPSIAESSAGFTDNDQFEFMEFTNTSPSTTLDLTNVRITHGFSVEFNFASSAVTSLDPGQYVLVVRDLNAFRARYGTGLNGIIAGTYAGSLDNGGERLRVIDPIGVEIHDFTYNDNHPWPATPDGYGFSLNLVDPASNPDHDDKDNWTGESPVNGSPGAANVTSQPQIVINEILAHTDQPQVDKIELHNPTGSPVDVGGWYLSDDSNALKKYEIPAAKVIPANSYLVLLEDDDGNPLTPPGPDYFGSAFSLSAVGEELYLSAGDGTDLLGYNESIRFGASLNGETMGRFPNATGRLFPMLINTMGSQNSEPRIGAVVITEIMYHPPSPGGGGDANMLEFLEIQNRSIEAIDLSDWSTWEINGIGYEFPVDQWIEPGEVLVILPFDPVLDAAAVANFNAEYGVNIGANPARYLGPYPGKLSNGGERLTLYSVDQPPASDPTAKPLIFQDEADYDDVSPWPSSPDGTGDSLHRTAPDDFGSDWASWTAASPSPGVNTFGPLGDLERDGDVDFDDIDPFVLGLTNQPLYEAQYRITPIIPGDVNQDGRFDFDDIPDFVALLTGPPATAAASAAGPDTLATSPLGSTPAAGDQDEVLAESQVDRTDGAITPQASAVARELAVAVRKRPAARPFRTVRWATSPADVDAVWANDSLWQSVSARQRTPQLNRS
ncbi:MAG: hypothetical protein BMS9Abin04_548 [Planctomycetia bacterium]|nr:MAG: hypothetical protein BMS9Abin04_548 [Planctomycetia bacterium]